MEIEEFVAREFARKDYIRLYGREYGAEDWVENNWRWFRGVAMDAISITHAYDTSQRSV